MVRTRGYLKSLDDFRAIPVQVSEGGTPVLLKDVARVQLGPEMRRGIAELDGEGEVVGGIVVLRSGKNAWETIQAVKARLEQLKPGLAGGRRDRSRLRPLGADRARGRPPEGQARRGVRRRRARVPRVPAASALGAGGGGVAAARRAGGVRRDAHARGQRQHHVAGRHRDRDRRDGRRGDRDDRERAQEARGVASTSTAARRPGDERWQVITDASVEVGPALFFSLLIITLSFVPVFTLEAQEGRMFAPLAFTKTYAMAAAAGLAVTLVPVLMGYFVRGRIPSEGANPLNRLPDRRLPAVAARRARLAEGDARRRRACARGDRVAGAAARRRVHAAAGRRRPSLHADRAARTVGGQGRRAPAADRSPDQDRSRGRGRVRQGRARGNGDRPGADGDDRDDDPVQAARRVAAGHDDGEARSRSSTARCRCRASRTSGCRPSATGSTCSRPASRVPIGIKVAGPGPRRRSTA